MRLPRLVLMPGLDGTGIFFRPIIRSLVSGVSPYVITYPAEERFSLAEYARFVGGQLPEDDVVLVAESFSGLVALMLLHERPVNVRGVVFSATFAEPLHHLFITIASSISITPSMVLRMPASAMNFLLFGPYASKELKELLCETLVRLSPDILKHRAGLIASGYPFLEERFDIPCLYLQASRDRLVPKQAARWFAGHFTSFELARFEAPHCLLQTRPADCAERIMEFVRKVSTAMFERL